MRLQSLNRFSGGMDSDSHDKEILPEDYRKMYGMGNTRSNGGNHGMAASRNGNILIPNPSLPAGDNISIGAFEDSAGNSIIDFNCNSNGNHGIFRYSNETRDIEKLTISDVYNFNTNWLIHSASLVDGKFLQWTDAKVLIDGIVGNPMRLADISRMSVKGKQVCFDLLLKENSYSINRLILSIAIRRGTVNSIINVIVKPYTVFEQQYTKKELIELIATKISAATNLITVDTCGGCKVEMCFKSPGDNYLVVSSGDVEMVSFPTNIYPENYKEIHVTLGRRPMLCSPKIQPKVDPEMSANFIDGRLFQFATRIVYYDDQKSVLSPYSKLTTNLVPCGSSESPYNCIEIDYSDAMLDDASDLAFIKYVEILVRETNTGSWKSVEKIDVCDLHPSIYCFKNDGNYSVVADAVAYKTSERIPLLSGAHDFAENRSWWASTLENYDNLPCPDIKLSIDYQKEEDITGCSSDNIIIKGRVFIHNDFITGPANADIRKNQPINDQGSGPVFGGIGNGGTGYNPEIYGYNPIPLGGFLVYVAGTSIYNVSKQIAATNGVTVTNTETNVYDATSTGKGQKIVDKANATGIWSEYSLTVPKNYKKVIIRVASHLCATDGRNGEDYNITNGTKWQTTSTFVKEIGNQEKYEIELDLSSAVNNEIDLAGVEDIVIADMSDPDAGKTSALVGYLIDGFTDWSGDTEVLKTGIRMESVSLDNIIGEDGSLEVVCPNRVTDYNGFWFFAFRRGAAATVKKFSADFKVGVVGIVREQGQQVYEGTLANLDADTLVGKSDMEAGEELVNHIIYNHQESITNCQSSSIIGRVLSIDGSPAQGIKILSTRIGRVSTTDINGNFKILIYAGPFGLRIEKLYAYSGTNCCVDFEDGNTKVVGIFPFNCSGGYNLNTPFQAGNFLISIKDFEGQMVWKHRNLKKIGVRYYDELGRPSKVQISTESEIYIPFYTENNGDVRRPVIKWEINHQPPIWAKKFQLMRTLNPLYNRYLQFATNEVKYVKNFGTTIAETTYEAGDATEIYIGISSLIDYANQNSGSVLAWTFQPGDRLTLMKDSNDVWFDKFYDFKVQNSRITDNALGVTALVIKYDASIPKLLPRTILEVYNPRKENTEDVYYEFGECQDILDAGTENRRHKGGLMGVDQTSLVAATGFLMGGDTYMHNRRMPIKEPGDLVSAGTEVIHRFESEYIYENDEESRQQCIGRPDNADQEFKQNYELTRIRFTGVFRPETNINGLATFNELDYVTDQSGTKEISRQFGPIAYLRYVGNVLMAVCWYKCQPIYIGAAAIYDLNGSSNVSATSSRIASLALPIKEDRGTQNPESCVIENGELYAYDFNKGAYWRYAVNGIFDISDFKMINYWSDITKALQSKKLQKVISTYDRKNEELVVTSSDIETITFNNKLAGDVRKNRWNAVWPFIPEMYGRVSETIVSFVNGQLWLHEANPIQNVFYGVKHPFGVDFVVNNNYDTKKIFWNIRVKSNKKFITPVDGIVIPPNSSYPEGHISELSLENKWKLAEGDFYADFLRDSKDPVFSSIDDENLRKVTSLLRGRHLRGDIVRISLRNNSENQVILEGVVVESSLSNKTK